SNTATSYSSGLAFKIIVVVKAVASGTVATVVVAFSTVAAMMTSTTEVVKEVAFYTRAAMEVASSIIVTNSSVKTKVVAMSKIIIDLSKVACQVVSILILAITADIKVTRWVGQNSFVISYTTAAFPYLDIN
ncbi:MAG: hypothetical protein ACK56F_27620, partial [bacterium]